MKNSLKRINCRRCSDISQGYSLIEVVIVIVIVAILASLAIPSYARYIQHGKLTSSTERLMSLRGTMEQAYQVDRSYQDVAGACAITDFSDDYFSHNCVAASKSTFTWTSTSRVNVGLGEAGRFVYTIDQDGTRTTTKYAGVILDSYSGWKLKD